MESVNDPSAGSPTDTLLRLLLPLSDKVYSTSQREPVRRVHLITRNR